jgi:hypothetical protein
VWGGAPSAGGEATVTGGRGTGGTSSGGVPSGGHATGGIATGGMASGGIGNGGSVTGGAGNGGAGGDGACSVPAASDPPYPVTFRFANPGTTTLWLSPGCAPPRDVAIWTCASGYQAALPINLAV